MPIKYKPTKEDADAIRRCACKSAGFRAVEICPGERVNIEGKFEGVRSMNIALVSDDPDFSDTDLWSNAWKWSDFRKGVELTDDGRGVFDFYVYGPLGHHKELQTNVTAYYEGGKLARIEGTCNGVMWRADVPARVSR